MKTHRSRLRQWRRQMIRRLCNSPRRSPSPVVMSYLTKGPVVEGLIEIENLTLVVLHEEPCRRHQPLIRFAGFSGRRTPSGVTFGGTGGNVFRKDLSAEPQEKPRDHRLDLRNTPLVDLALRMERHLHRHMSWYQHKPRPSKVPMPPVLVGFRASATRRLGLADEFGNGQSNDGNGELSVNTREYFGLRLFPIDDVHQHVASVTAVFADLADWPNIRTVDVTELAADLCGRQGAVEFALYRNSPRRRRRTRRRTPNGAKRTHSRAA